MANSVYTCPPQSTRRKKKKNNKNINPSYTLHTFYRTSENDLPFTLDSYHNTVPTYQH